MHGSRDLADASRRLREPRHPTSGSDHPWAASRAESEELAPKTRAFTAGQFNWRIIVSSIGTTHENAREGSVRQASASRRHCEVHKEYDEARPCDSRQMKADVGASAGGLSPTAG